MNKLAKKMVIFAAAMVMMLASSLTVFAKENEAVPRIVDNVMYVDEGSNNVWVYGVAISIAGGNKTDIVPNNPSKKIDVMANGQLFKQLDGVVLLKDEKKDRVFLEAGSTVIEAPSITDKALVTLKKAIADGKADSITAAQVLGTTADKGALAYQIAENGKVLTASGEDMATLLKTNANYKSVLNAFEEAVKAAEEAAKEAEEAAKEATISASESSGSTTPSVIYYTIDVNKNSMCYCTLNTFINGEKMEDGTGRYKVEKGARVEIKITPNGNCPGYSDLNYHDWDKKIDDWDNDDLCNDYKENVDEPYVNVDPNNAEDDPSIFTIKEVNQNYTIQYNVIENQAD